MVFLFKKVPCKTCVSSMITPRCGRREQRGTGRWKEEGEEGVGEKGRGKGRLATPSIANANAAATGRGGGWICFTLQKYFVLFEIAS